MPKRNHKKRKTNSNKRSKKQNAVKNLIIEKEKNEIKNSSGNFFEVEKIIKKKIVKNETYYYLKWKNWDPSYNQWVHEKGGIF